MPHIQSQVISVIEHVQRKLWKYTMLFNTKNATIILVKKKTVDCWRESGRTSSREQKLILELSYAFFVERETQQNICVLQESFTLVVARIINMSRNQLNLRARWLYQFVIWMYLQNYVLAMFVINIQNYELEL